MSAFHNSIAGEKLAHAWHKFGTRVSKIATIASTLCIFWSIVAAIVPVLVYNLFELPKWAVLVLLLTAAHAVFAALCHFGCAVVAAGGVAWHRGAEKDHEEHMKALGSDAQ